MHVYYHVHVRPLATMTLTIFRCPATSVGAAPKIVVTASEVATLCSKEPVYQLFVIQGYCKKEVVSL